MLPKTLKDELREAKTDYLEKRTKELNSEAEAAEKAKQTETKLKAKENKGKVAASKKPKK